MEIIIICAPRMNICIRGTRSLFETCDWGGLLTTFEMHIKNIREKCHIVSSLVFVLNSQIKVFSWLVGKSLLSIVGIIVRCVKFLLFSHGFISRIFIECNNKQPTVQYQASGNKQQRPPIQKKEMFLFCNTMRPPFWEHHFATQWKCARGVVIDV